MIHTVKDFGIVNKAEVDVFLMLILIFWQGGVEVCHVVTKHKFPVPSEAKHHQNVMLEFGAEKGPCRAIQGDKWLIPLKAQTA